MSTADIADNKWELEASKPPIRTLGGVLQLVVISFFAGLFVWMLAFTFQGIFGAKRETLADQYGRLIPHGGPPAEAPAAQ